MRSVTTAMGEALEAPIVRPVIICRLDLATDPVLSWNGPGFYAPTATGDAALDGFVYDPEEALLDLSEISENQGIGSPLNISVKANALSQSALRQLVRDRRQWRGRNAYVWMGILNETEGEVVSEPVRIKTGVMTQVVINRSGSDESVDITVDLDLGNSRSAAFRWTDHQGIYSDDTLTGYVFALANKPQGLTKSDISAPAQIPTYPNIDPFRSFGF
jgi:hypothetical protein